MHEELKEALSSEYAELLRREIDEPSGNGVAAEEDKANPPKQTSKMSNLWSKKQQSDEGFSFAFSV